MRDLAAPARLAALSLSWALVWVTGACAGPSATAAPPTSPVLAPAPPTLSEADDACLAAARACARTLIAKDYGGTADCMPEETVKLAGGRGAIVELLRKGMAQLAETGVRFEGAQVEPPSQMARGADRAFAILPQLTVMKVPEGHLRSRGFLVGVSSSDGRKWRFIDGVKLTRQSAEQMFPDFPRSLTLPAPEAPELVH